METTPAHQAIFDHVQNKTAGNAVISAVAGAGKTTTLVRMLGLIPASQRVVFLAFGKKNALDLKDRVPPHVKTQTLNSLGHGAYMAWMRVNGLDPSKLVLDGDKVHKLAKAMCEAADAKHMIGAVTKLTRFAKTVGMQPRTTDTVKFLVTDTRTEWEALIDHHDLEVPARDGEDEDVVRDAWIGLCRKVLHASFAERMTIDFDDQLYMSVLLNAKVSRYDWVFVDEAQDLNALQHELVARAIAPYTGRMVAVGDERQCIFGFRGVVNDSLGVLSKRFNCAQLPLHVSYRCPKAVVAKAQEFVGHIQAHESAPEGELDDRELPLWKHANSIKAGDWIICRFSAPLVQARMWLLKRGVPAAILGDDIGAALLALVEKLKPRGLQDLTNRLAQWEAKQVERAMKKDNTHLANRARDRADCLRIFMEGVTDLSGLESVIRTSFTDAPGTRVTLSTVHKAKGAEADTVYVVDLGAVPANVKKDWQLEQETNIAYVSVTRAKKKLVLVTIPRNAREPSTHGSVSIGSLFANADAKVGV